MTMPTRALCALLAALALAAAPAGAHEVRSETHDYVLGTPPPGLCPAETGEAFGIGGACFDVDPATDLYVRLSADDELSADVAFFYLIHDAAGGCADGTTEDCRSAGFACNATGYVYVPATSHGIRINILDPALGTVACLSEAAAGVAVKGTITASFWD